MKTDLLPEEGRQLLASLPGIVEEETVGLWDAYGRVSAEEIRAEIPCPPFSRSPYDGYAFSSGDTASASRDFPVQLLVRGEIAAGEVGSRVEGGTAVRIMTGAPIPSGADTVIKWEDVRMDRERLLFSAPVSAGNIIPAGEDIAVGEPLLRRGDVLTPAHIAVVAAQGISSLRVYRRPCVSIISTGPELLQQGKPLMPGKIYGSNLYLLAGYLKRHGILPQDGGMTTDCAKEIAEKIQTSLQNADVVITTGGVSTGKYDVTAQAVLDCGGEILFQRLRCRPGGAMLVGQISGKIVLCLSGNPCAAAIGFLYAGLPYLNKLCGKREIYPRQTQMRLSRDVKPCEQTRFLCGTSRIEKGCVLFEETKRKGHGSISPLLGCTWIAEIPPSRDVVPAETVVTCFCPE